MQVLPRELWAGDAPPPPPPRYGRVEAAVIHHTALGAGDAPEDVPRLIRAVRDLHVDGNGWDDIGYNLLVDRFGRCWEGRAGGIERAVVGAHARGHNATTTGIAVLGDHSTAPPSPAALTALRELIAFKLGLHGLAPGPATVLPHSALADTRCPGPFLALEPCKFGGAAPVGWRCAPLSAASS